MPEGLDGAVERRGPERPRSIALTSFLTLFYNCMMAELESKYSQTPQEPRCEHHVYGAKEGVIKGEVAYTRTGHRYSR